MDGSNRQILHNTSLVWPNGITIDIPGQIIYWIDANLDTIEFSFTNGSGRTLLERRDDEIFHPFSITLADDFLFWTDWVEQAIFTTHRDSPNDNIVPLNLYSTLLYPPHGIEAVTPDRQPDGMFRTKPSPLLSLFLSLSLSSLSLSLSFSLCLSLLYFFPSLLKTVWLTSLVFLNHTHNLSNSLSSCDCTLSL